MTYCAANRPVRIPTPYARAFKYNYMVVSNSTPVEGESKYYYFITDMRYVAPNTTEVVLQLDVWTTYYNKFRFGRFFLSRGHATNWLHHKYGTADGREYLARPEGLDTGPSYLIGDCNSWALTSNTDTVRILIASTVSLVDAYGTVDAPQLKVPPARMINGIPYPIEVLACTWAEFSAASNYLKDYPWIAQGIIGVYIVPASMVETIAQPTHLNGTAGPTVHYFSGSKNVTHTVYSNFRNDIKAKLPERYRTLEKFLTSPYSYIEVTTYSGTPLMVAPEMVTSTDFTLQAWPWLVPPSQRIIATVHNLGQHGNKPNSYLGYEEHLDSITGITNLPTLPMVNNQATMYAASNAHSIAYAKESAAWQQQKAIAGANLSADQATAGINAGYAQTANSVTAGAQQLAISTDARNRAWGVNTAFGVGTSAAKGVIGGAAGGPAGMVAGGAAGAATAGVGAAQSYFNNQIANEAAAASFGVSANAAMQSNAISSDLAAYVRDGNLALATSNARGDYANAIAGINAKLQDAQLTPPSVAGQIGGDMLNFAKFGIRIDTRIKIPTMGVIRALGEFWFRYGYAFNGFIVPPTDLMVMTNMTYWQCVEANVFGDLPQTMIDVMRGALQRGTTVWRRPQDIGTMDPANNTYNDSAVVS